MEFQVANVRTTCTTLILSGLYYSTTERFREKIVEAVDNFDKGDSTFHRNTMDYDGDPYRHPVEVHAGVFVTTVSGQYPAHKFLEEAGFRNLGETRPSKTGSFLTTWFIEVDKLMEYVEECRKKSSEEKEEEES